MTIGRDLKTQDDPAYQTYLNSISNLVEHAEKAEKENTELRERVREAERLKKIYQEQALDWEEREASVCPEDVGFPEYIRALEKQKGELTAALARLRQAAQAVRDYYDEDEDINNFHKKYPQYSDFVGVELEKEVQAALKAELE